MQIEPEEMIAAIRERRDAKGELAGGDVSVLPWDVCLEFLIKDVQNAHSIATENQALKAELTKIKREGGLAKEFIKLTDIDPDNPDVLVDPIEIVALHTRAKGGVTAIKTRAGEIIVKEPLELILHAVNADVVTATEIKEPVSIGEKSS